MTDDAITFDLPEPVRRSVAEAGVEEPYEAAQGEWFPTVDFVPAATILVPPPAETDGLPASRSTPRSLERYARAFSALRRAPGSRYWSDDLFGRAPHKPLVLLATMELFESGVLSGNFIPFEGPMLAHYQSLWDAVVGASRPSRVDYPLLYLRSEGFWCLQPVAGYERELALCREAKSLAHLQRMCRGASLDEDLYALLLEDGARAALRKALLEGNFAGSALATLQQRTSDAEPVTASAAPEPPQAPAGGASTLQPEDETQVQDLDPRESPAAADGTAPPELPGPAAALAHTATPGEADPPLEVLEALPDEAGSPVSDRPAPMAADGIAVEDMSATAEPVVTSPAPVSDPEGSVDDVASATTQASESTDLGPVLAERPAVYRAEGSDSAADDLLGQVSALPAEIAETSLRDREGEPGGRCKIHVEVFVASRILAGRQETFRRRELIAEIRERFGDLRYGVIDFVRSARCVANRPYASHHKFNYLWELSGDVLRCFDPDTDLVTADRLAAPLQPDPLDVPPEYRRYLRSLSASSVRTLPISRSRPTPDGAAGAPQTLGGWELLLRERLRGVDLIGQAGLTRGDTRALGALIGESVRTRGPDRTVTHLRRYNPAVLVAYLVFQGLYGYLRGNYWGAVCAQTGLPYEGMHTANWGYQFVNTCRELGLRSECDAETYVDLILLHAGVPTSCLPDFFEQMIVPSLTRPDWSALEAPELIAHWLNGSTRYFVAKPVIRFLEQGGAIAEEYVRDWRGVVAGHRAGQPWDTLATRLLPAHLVQEYATWVSSEGDSSDGDASTVAPRERFRAPELVLDPWRLGVHLRLPEQVVAGDGRWRPVWRLTIDRDAHSVATRASARRRCWRTEHQVFPLQQPFRHLQVALQSGRHQHREWLMSGGGADTGFLLFNAESGRVSQQLQDLHGERWWLLLAPGSTMAAFPEGVECIRERLPALSDGWSDWTGLEIDLAAVSHVEVRGRSGTVRLRPQADRAGLRLLGGNRLRADIPIYVGSPPVLLLEHSDGRIGVEAVTVRSAGATQPQCYALLTAHDLLADTPDPTLGVTVRLDRRGLLGHEPFGEYAIECVGDAGTTVHRRFRVVPHLHLSAPEQLVLPDAQGNQDVWVSLVVDRATELTLEDLSQILGMATDPTPQSSCVYRLHVAPATTLLRLRLVRSGAGAPASVALRVPIPRLRWRLSTCPGAHTRWGSEALSTSLDEIDQSTEPALFVDAPMLAEGAEVTLLAVGRDGTEMQTLDPGPQSTVRRVFQYDLRPLKDTLRRVHDLDVTLRLRVHTPGACASDVDLVRVTEHPAFDCLEIRGARASDGWHLDVQWAPDRPLRWRQLRLHSISRPWQPPSLLDIADEARGVCALTCASEALVDGPYLVEMVAQDPWLAFEAEPERPSPGVPHVVTASLGEEHARLNHLHGRFVARTATYEEVAELLFLASHRGDHGLVPVLLDHLYRNMASGPLHVLVSIAAAFSSEPSGQALGLGLFAPGRVREAAEAWQGGDWTRTQLEAYLSTRPSLRKLQTEALVALLDIDDQATAANAARILIEREVDAGYLAVAGRYAAGELDLSDAVDLLEANPARSIAYLADRYGEASLKDLLDALQSAHPEHIRLVRPGYWVCCEAGWARIDAIGAPSGQSVECASIEDISRCGVLEVVVRPDADALRVTLEPSRQQLRVHGRFRGLFGCAKCRRFLATDADVIRGKHNHAAHGGIGIGIRTLGQTGLVRTSASLNYAVKPPSNIWA